MQGWSLVFYGLLYTRPPLADGAAKKTANLQQTQNFSIHMSIKIFIKGFYSLKVNTARLIMRINLLIREWAKGCFWGQYLQFRKTIG